MTGPKLNIKSLNSSAQAQLKKVRPYSFLIFIVFIAAIYGFVFLRISSLHNVEPSPTAVSDQVKAAQIPHVDPAIVKQLESLQDNSVSVKALFDQARSNPFQ
jgi:hypothetical protein